MKSPLYRVAPKSGEVMRGKYPNLIDLAIQPALAGVVIAWLYKREIRAGAVPPSAATGVR
jgi:hypothetical protein